MADQKPLLELKNVVTRFKTDEGLITILDHVNFSIGHAETVGVVGESGSGKSVTALSVMRLLPRLTGQIAEGEILYEGRDLVKLSECTGIIMLPNWKKSKGAKFELSVAKFLGLEIIYHSR